MSESLYFGEIAALISGKIYSNPDHLLRINWTVNQDHKSRNVHTICAEAAKIFDEIELLAKDKYTNTIMASEIYADELLDFLLSGRVPTHLDMISLTAQSLKSAS
jgi:hypothetical protein